MAATNTYIALFTTYSSGTVFLILRLISRRMKKNDYWADDYFAMAAWVFATVWNSLLIIWISHGFGQHIDQLSKPKATVLYYSKLLTWNLDLFYAFSLGCSKLSVLSLYWRLFSITSIRHPIQWLSVAALAWIIVRTFMNIFMCLPVQGFWDKTIKSTCNIDERKFFFGTTLTHLLIDVAILCLPVWQICQLRLEKLPRVGLCITFGFGTMTCIASIIVLAPAFHYSELSDDITWNNVSMFIWATVEVNLAIVAGSFPMIRGAVARLINRRPNGSHHDQQNELTHAPERSHQHIYKMSAIALTSRTPRSESTTNLAVVSYDLGS